jgi:hypothetical protein
MQGVDYGPGRIDAGLILDYVGQAVSACGRVGLVNQRDSAFVIGNQLRVFAPLGSNLQEYFGKVVCARGRVEARGSEMEGRYAVIDAQSLADIELIGGTGPYSPPRPQCGPGEMYNPAARGCVRRTRASLHGQ